MYKGKKLVPKDLQTLKIHASALRNSLVAAEAAGGPRARARCVVRVSRHGATLSPRPALGACQPCPSMIHARARACSDDDCLCLTARTRKRGGTHIGQWQSHAHGRHGLSSCARPMHDPHDAQPLNLPVRAQNSQVGHRGRHAAERRRHEVDIGFVSSGGCIEWLGLASVMRGLDSAVRFMYMHPIANAVPHPVLPSLVRAYDFRALRADTQEIRYKSVTRARAYVRSGPPCDSHCEPQCLRLWHREVYCEACGVTSREAFRAGAGGGL